MGVSLVFLALAITASVGTTLVLVYPSTRSDAVLGCALLVPPAYGVCDFVVDPLLAFSRSEPGLGVSAMLCTVILATAMELVVGLVVLRALQRHRDAVLAALALMMLCGGLLLSVRAGFAAPRPGHDSWRAYLERLDDSLRVVDAPAVLQADAARFVALAPPPFFEHAFAARVPELSQGSGLRDWRLPGGRSIALSPGGLAGCPLEAGESVVLLQSSEGVLALHRGWTGKWMACDVDEPYRWLTASRAHFRGFGAPPACAWLLALGVATAAVVLASAWRDRRAASRMETLPVARVRSDERDVVVLEDGTVARVTHPVPAGIDTVLASEVAVSPLEYRDDPRLLVRGWLEAPGGRAALVERWRARVATKVSLALVVVLWLALPALSALRHGFALSFGAVS